MRSVRLKPGCRIGVKMFGIIYAKPIARVRPSFGRSGKVSAFLALQRMKRSLRVLLRAFFENNIDMFRFRGPNAEVCFVYADQFRADGIAAKLSGIGHAGFSPLSRVTAVGFDDLAFPVQHRYSRTCGRLLRKQPKRECEALHGPELKQFGYIVRGLSNMGDQCSSPGGIQTDRSREC